MAEGTELDPAASSPLDVEKPLPDVLDKDTPEDEYPNWRRVALVMVALYLSMFLVALVSTLIPQLCHTRTFNSPKNRIEP